MDGGLVSPSVVIGLKEGRGRLVRARRDLLVGETVAQGDVFVWALLPQEARRLCAHCAQRLPSGGGIAGVKCPGGCTSVWYCPAQPQPQPPPEEDSSSGGCVISASTCEQEGQRGHTGAGCRSMRKYQAAVAVGLRRGSLAPSLFNSPDATMLARFVIGVLTHPDRRRRDLVFGLESNIDRISETRLGQYEVSPRFLFS